MYYKRILSVGACLLLTVACHEAGPTSPSAGPSAALDTASFDKGASVTRSFDVSFAGDIETDVSAIEANVKSNDSRMHLHSFPMDDISFLAGAVEGGATCFADTQIGADENIELLIGTPKRGPDGAASLNYWFDGVSQDGNYTLYRLVMTGTFTSGFEGWIGDATMSFDSWSINGQVEKGQGGKPDKSQCSGGGEMSTEVTITEAS